jgi:hypothetical protein
MVRECVAIFFLRLNPSSFTADFFRCFIHFRSSRMIMSLNFIYNNYHVLKQCWKMSGSASSTAAREFLTKSLCKKFSYILHYAGNFLSSYSILGNHWGRFLRKILRSKRRNLLLNSRLISINNRGRLFKGELALPWVKT